MPLIELIKQLELGALVLFLIAIWTKVFFTGLGCDICDKCERTHSNWLLRL